MIIWMGWYVLSVVSMAYVGLRRYSVSNRLMHIFLEVSSEKIEAYEFLWIFVEMFLVFSDEGTWEHHIVVTILGLILLFVSQFMLMRIAGKVTSSVSRYICEKRLNLIRVSRKIRARMRYAHEFE